MVLMLLVVVLLQSLLLIAATSLILPCGQWCRSVVQYGGQGQSGQAIKLFQITPYVNDSMIPEHSTIPVPDSL